MTHPVLFLGLCFDPVGVFVQVHYTAGTDGYVILNKEELPQELPFSVCSPSPPDVQVNVGSLKKI